MRNNNALNQMSKIQNLQKIPFHLFEKYRSEKNKFNMGNKTYTFGMSVYSYPNPWNLKLILQVIKEVKWS
jgi:hypothetical protein